jgi:hypothetical protein
MAVTAELGFRFAGSAIRLVAPDVPAVEPKASKAAATRRLPVLAIRLVAPDVLAVEPKASKAAAARRLPVQTIRLVAPDILVGALFARVKGEKTVENGFSSKKTGVSSKSRFSFCLINVNRLYAEFHIMPSRNSLFRDVVIGRRDANNP